ncbi:MAG: zinc dependent phospholipase C family protein, partial [Eubacterium sp.]
MMPFLKETADFEIKEDAVLFGTQGPDIFFFHRIFPWMPGKPLLKYGSMLHRAKPDRLFENMREYFRVSDNKDVAQSYVYGFILHYALDRNCHPYVYCLQNKITDKHKLTNPHSAHNTVEFSLDSYLLNKRLGIKCPEKFSTAETISDNAEIISEIGRLLEYVIPKTIGKSITALQGETALRDIKYVQKLSA